MSRHCAWCGQFVRADAEPMRFRNALGDAVSQGPLCPSCERSCRDMAARNVSRAPNLAYFQSMRDQYGWPEEPTR